MGHFFCIPARAGSVRCPGKNTRDFGGKALVSHTIEAAQQVAGEGDAVVLVTNDPEVEAIGRALGVHVPSFLDPALFEPTVPSWRPCWEAMLEIEMEGQEFSEFFVLQPTSPMRDAGVIRRCLALLEGDFDAVTTVTPLDPHMTHWTVKALPDGSIAPVFGAEALKTDRHALETHYMLNGAVKAVSVSTMKKTGDIWGNHLGRVEMPFLKSIHIATEEDFLLSELVYKNLIF